MVRAHSHRTAALAMGLLLAGCGVRMPDPVVDGVEPDRGWSGEDTVVTILGAGFYPQIEMDAGRRGSADLDRSFVAWLEGPDGGGERFDLSGVSARDAESLRAIVEAGLEPGLYDLVVEGPTGRTGRLDDAFTVSDTRADRLAVDAPELIWEVNNFAQVDVFLLDPNGERVFTEFPVEVLVSGEDDSSVPVTFGAGGLVEQVVLPDGGAITGDLGADGFARILLSVSEPGTYTVSASPVNARSGVDGGELKLLFEPGGDLSLDIRLPDAAFVAEAGQPFDVELELRDQFGNPVPEQAVTVALRNTCNTWLDLVMVSGVTVLPVQLDVATGDACPEDGIVTDEASSVKGASTPFEVLPGPVDHFELEVVPDPVVAGEALLAKISPVDAWDNEADWAGTLTLTDSVGGLVSPVCSGLQGSASLCVAQTTVAGDAVVLTAIDQVGVVGTSDPYAVLPSSVVGSVEVTVLDPAVAGTPATVETVVRDPWGNVIDAAGLGSDAVDLADDLGEAGCSFLTFTAAGAAQHDCTLYTARPDAVLTAAVDGIEGSSPGFAVDNGELAVVTVTAAGPVTAGATFPMTLTGTDAWGNPYVVQSDPLLDLADSTGTLTVNSASLGPSGTAAVNGKIYKAGTTTITASQGGVELGASSPLTVVAGSSTGLRVSVDEPWAWLGVPVEVRVESVDTWGNRSDIDGTATLSSRATATADATVAVTNGVGTVQYTWAEVALDEVLDGTLGALTGESEPLHVVQDCGVDGPLPVLAFGGYDEAIACFDPVVGHATVAGSFAGSAAGDGTLVSYVLAAFDGPTVTSATDSALLELPEEGIHPLGGLVVQDDACAAEVEATAFVGPDDGSPVGPITLAPLDASIDAIFGTTTVEVLDVVDCSRDVAVGATVKLRTTLGDLVGTTATGTGPAVTLDANGDALVTLDAAPVRTAGAATLHAWVDSGAAAGLAAVDVVQDFQLPTVWEQIPAGEVPTPVSEVRLVFSEPMRPNNAVPANFVVTGPAAVSVLDVRLENGDTEMVLTLDPPADGALGAWDLVASDALRDAAGNRLAGTWDGTRAPYEGVFGDVGATVDPVTCGPAIPEGGAFRPDGDDGAGIEADAVEVEVTTAVAPTWWVLSVTRQSTGLLRRRDYLVPAGAVDTLTWSGRDSGGRVVDNGVYLLEVEPVDGLGNRGEGCSVTVTVDNRMGALP